MDALIGQVVAMRSKLCEVAKRITPVEEMMSEAGAWCPVDTGSGSVGKGGEVEMWGSAVSWISILLPMLCSPVVVFGLLIWGSCRPGGGGGVEGGQPEELPEVGGVQQDQPLPAARPWYVRAFLGALNGVMAGNPA